MTARHRLLDSIKRSRIEDRFRAEVETFKLAIENSHPINRRDSNRQRETEASLEVTVYSDILANEGVIIHDF